MTVELDPEVVANGYIQDTITQEQEDSLRIWIDALESGDYFQATGVLSKPVGHARSYCCLGVACDLVDPSRWAEKLSPTTEGFRWGSVGPEEMPTSIMLHQYGITETGDEDLSHDNDRGQSFKEIARTLRNWFGIIEHPAVQL